MHNNGQEDSGILEALALLFHQDFDLLGGSVKETISSFIEETNPEDRLLLRGQISELLAFETENDRRRYLRLMGAAYWPPNETVEGVFRDALQLIEDRS